MFGVVIRSIATWKKRNEMGQAKQRGTREQRVASATPKTFKLSGFESAKHWVMIFDKSAKGLELIQTLQSGDGELQGMFRTSTVQQWIEGDMPYLLRAFTIGKSNWQTMMVPDLSMLLNGAIPSAVERIGTKIGLQLILAVDAEVDDIIAGRFREITAASNVGVMLGRSSQERESFLEREHRRLVEANIRNDKDLSREIFLNILLPFSVPLEQPTGPYSRLVETAKRRGVNLWLFQQGTDLYGVTIFHQGVPHVFVRADQDDIEAVDTLLHELVHATGPSLKRWTWKEQPQKLGQLPDLDYEKEELIAVMAATQLIGITNGVPTEVVETAVKKISEQHWRTANLSRFVGAISMNEIDEARVAAVDYLLQ